MSRDLEARQCRQVSNQDERISFVMAENSNTLFLHQVQNLAPNIFHLLNSKVARITAAIASHDVVNGYGRGFTFHLKLELLIEQCLSCCETQFSQPTFDCRWHRFEKRFMQVADAEAPTLEKALMKIEAAMIFREERMAA